MGTIANILGFGQATGPHYQIDYSTGTGSGILTLTQAQLATSNGVANVMYLDDAATAVTLRTEVDGDPIATGGYSRAEWRELATDGTTLRAFNRETGDHKVEVLVCPLHLPPIKPSFVVCQMHDANDDICEIAVQPRTDFATSGKLEVVNRINGTSSGIPKLIADFGTPAQLGDKWLYCWIRVGLIAPGSVAGWQAHCNGFTINSWDAGMPAMTSIGATGSYFKSGMYLQTRWSGMPNGTPGVETDRNEYGEAKWKLFKTYHNGESAPFNPTIGTDAALTVVSSARWGALASVTKPAATPSATVTPAFPTAGNVPLPGELVFAVIEARRSSTSVVATPAVDDSNVWQRVVNAPTLASTPDPATGSLQANTMRYQVYVAQYVTGMAAPVFTHTSGANDIVKAIIGCVAGSKLGLAAVGEQTALGVSVAAPQTTTLGPAPAMAAAVPAGSMVLARCSHEYPKASGTLPAITGDSLTWTEALENITDWCFVIDYAFNVSAVTPVQKTVATTTISTAGRGVGMQCSILPRNRRANLIVAA